MGQLDSALQHAPGRVAGELAGARLRWTPPDLHLLGRVLAGLRRMD